MKVKKDKSTTKKNTNMQIITYKYASHRLKKYMLSTQKCKSSSNKMDDTKNVSHRQKKKKMQVDY